MKSTTLYVAVLSGLFATLVGCSGSGTTVKRVDYCSPDTKNYVPLDDDNFDSITKLEDNTPFDPATGLYEFASAQLFFDDPINDIRALVNVSRVEEPDPANPNAKVETYKGDVACLGGKGILPDMPTKIMSLPIVTDFRSAGRLFNRKVTVIFTVSSAGTEVTFVGDNSEKSGSPKDTYFTYPSNEALFATIKNSDAARQIRARVVSEETDNKTNEVIELDLRARVSFTYKP